jgi:gamma-glutamyl hydrolase
MAVLLSHSFLSFFYVALVSSLFQYTFFELIKGSVVIESLSYEELGISREELEPFPHCHVVNQLPIIGILTQPTEMPSFSEYIAASYVKFVESAGARVVPIHYNRSKENLRKQLRGVNGLFFPGGDQLMKPGSPFFDASAVLYEFVIESNRRGIFYPLWGTCEGFEQLMAYTAGTEMDVLELSGPFDAEYLPSQNTFMVEKNTSALFHGMPETLLTAFKSKNVSYNAHRLGITPEVFFRSAKLRNFYTALSMSADRNGKNFVSAIEAKNGWPIYGVQFHPEKANFEWAANYNIPHAPEAIGISQYFANFFVSKARCNRNRMEGGFAAEQNALVISSCKKLVVNESSYFSEQYMW